MTTVIRLTVLSVVTITKLSWSNRAREEEVKLVVGVPLQVRGPLRRLVGPPLFRAMFMVDVPLSSEKHRTELIVILPTTLT